MIIRELVWSSDRVEHIARHEVTPDEVEQVCFGRSLVLRTKASGKNPVYHVLGQSDAGRYLFCVDTISWREGLLCDRTGDDRQGKTTLQRMGKAMKGQRIPETDSIEELARFWDTHDLTDFEDQLEEVPAPVFQGEPGARLSIRLNATELESLRRLASERGLEEAVLIREWVLEKLHQS